MSVMRSLARHLSVARSSVSQRWRPPAACAAGRAADGPARFTVLVQRRPDRLRRASTSRAAPNGWLIIVHRPDPRAVRSDDDPVRADLRRRLAAAAALDRRAAARPADHAGDDVRPDDGDERHDAGRPARFGHAAGVAAHDRAAEQLLRAYEALAARLGRQAVGARSRSTSRPKAEVGATVDRITPRRIVGPDGEREPAAVRPDVRQSGGPSVVEIWIDERIAAGARRSAGARPRRDSRRPRDGDGARRAHQESRRRGPVHSGAASTSARRSPGRPDVTGRAPAVILVGGPGRQDRDETLFGVPIFGQLAGALADAGYLRRPLRQARRRPERRPHRERGHRRVRRGCRSRSSTWLRKRKDVDADRIAVVGYAEGAAVALLGRGREKRIRALALVARPADRPRGHARAAAARCSRGSRSRRPSAQAKIATAAADDRRGRHRQGLGSAPAGPAPAGRHALVQELAAVRSGGRRSTEDRISRCSSCTARSTRRCRRRTPTASRSWRARARSVPPRTRGRSSCRA